MPGVFVPQQHGTSLGDAISKGMAIAQTIYGIKAAGAEAKAKALKTADERDGVLSQEQTLNYTKDMKPVASGTEGSVLIKTRYGNDVKEQAYIKPPQQKTGGLTSVDFKGPDGKWGKKTVVLKEGDFYPSKPEAPPAQGTSTITNYLDANGNPLSYNNKTNRFESVPLPKGSTNSKKTDEVFANLPKPQQEMVVKVTGDIANKTTIANMIDKDLANFKEAYDKGDEDLAIATGQNMLKTLNSTEGKDAVGAEEAKRLASFLEWKFANFTGPGSFIGRDLDKFYTQASQKSNAIKAAITSNQKIIEDIYSGKGMPTLEKTDPVLKTDGEAMARDKPGRTPEDNDAIKWARANPNDPRAAEILRMNGAK